MDNCGGGVGDGGKVRMNLEDLRLSFLSFVLLYVIYKECEVVLSI